MHPYGLAKEQGRYIREFGLLRGIEAFWKISFPLGQARVRVPGIDKPLVVRKGTTDTLVFNQVFITRRFKPLLSLVSWQPKLIIDGGAYVGYSSVMFAARFPSAKVLAIEPDRSNYRVLVENAGEGVKAIYAGVGSESGNIKVTNREGGHWGLKTESTSAADPDAVRVLTISELLSSADADGIDILKLNVEGAEKDIFSGNCEWLARTRLMMIDLHDHMQPGCSEAVYSAAKRFGFTWQLPTASDEHVIFLARNYQTLGLSS
jgi:FkbM family methyltransferase